MTRGHEGEMQASSVFDMLDALTPQHVIEILGMQERAFGNNGQSRPLGELAES